MTTKNSPIGVLKAQAAVIAGLIKAAERGEKIDAGFAERIEAARKNDSFKIGIAMDDKVITIEMPWVTIRATSEEGLAEYIVAQMAEARHAVN